MNFNIRSGKKQSKCTHQLDLVPNSMVRKWQTFIKFLKKIPRQNRNTSFMKRKRKSRVGHSSEQETVQIPVIAITLYKPRSATQTSYIYELVVSG